MPTISVFYGIKIEMYYNDHGVPHFHVRYAEHRAKYAIETLELLDGSLPRRAGEMVALWMVEHRPELLENWERAKERQPLFEIAPLE